MNYEEWKLLNGALQIIFPRNNHERCVANYLDPYLKEIHILNFVMLEETKHEMEEMLQEEEPTEVENFDDSDPNSISMFKLRKRRVNKDSKWKFMKGIFSLYVLFI